MQACTIVSAVQCRHMQACLKLKLFILFRNCNQELNVESIRSTLVLQFLARIDNFIPTRLKIQSSVFKDFFSTQHNASSASSLLPLSGNRGAKFCKYPREKTRIREMKAFASAHSLKIPKYSVFQPPHFAPTQVKSIVLC